MNPVINQLDESLNDGNKILSVITAEEHSQLTRSLLFANEAHINRLLTGIRSVDYSMFTESDWKQIRCLSILGDSDDRRYRICGENGVIPGAYLNWD